MTASSMDIPEAIWVELIISSSRFEMYAPKTEKTQAAYKWIKQKSPSRVLDGDPEIKSQEFEDILKRLNSEGSSPEHNKWRAIAIAAIKNGTI